MLKGNAYHQAIPLNEHGIDGMYSRENQWCSRSVSVAAPLTRPHHLFKLQCLRPPLVAAGQAPSPGHFSNQSGVTKRPNGRADKGNRQNAHKISKVVGGGCQNGGAKGIKGEAEAQRRGPRGRRVVTEDTASATGVQFKNSKRECDIYHCGIGPERHESRRLCIDEVCARCGARRR
jgi:hypothetical protein